MEQLVVAKRLEHLEQLKDQEEKRLEEKYPDYLEKKTIFLHKKETVEDILNTAGLLKETHQSITSEKRKAHLLFFLEGAFLMFVSSYILFSILTYIPNTALWMTLPPSFLFSLVTCRKFAHLTVLDSVKKKIEPCHLPFEEYSFKNASSKKVEELKDLIEKRYEGMQTDYRVAQMEYRKAKTEFDDVRKKVLDMEENSITMLDQQEKEVREVNHTMLWRKSPEELIKELYLMEEKEISEVGSTSERVLRKELIRK